MVHLCSGSYCCSVLQSSLPAWHVKPFIQPKLLFFSSHSLHCFQLEDSPFCKQFHAFWPLHLLFTVGITYLHHSCRHLHREAFPFLLSSARSCSTLDSCSFCIPIFLEEVVTVQFLKTEVQLINNAVLITALQQSDSVIHTHTLSLSFLFKIFFSIMVYHGILNIILCAIQ